MLKNFSTVMKRKKEIEVEEIIIYPIFRKKTDVITSKTIGVFKVDLYTITKVAYGEGVHPSIQVFDNDEDTLSVVYWLKEATKREYMKYLQQTKECIE